MTVQVVPSDIEIAQSATLRPITAIAADLGLSPDDIDQYGKYKAKLPLELASRPSHPPASRGARRRVPRMRSRSTRLMGGALVALTCCLALAAGASAAPTNGRIFFDHPTQSTILTI